MTIKFKSYAKGSEPWQSADFDIPEITAANREDALRACDHGWHCFEAPMTEQSKCIYCGGLTSSSQARR